MWLTRFPLLFAPLATLAAGGDPYGSGYSSSPGRGHSDATGQKPSFPLPSGKYASITSPAPNLGACKNIQAEGVEGETGSAPKR